MALILDSYTIWHMVSAVVGGLLLGVIIGWSIFSKKRTHMFGKLREELRIANTNLINASKSIHTIDETLESIENAAR